MRLLKVCSLAPLSAVQKLFLDAAAFQEENAALSEI